MKRQTIFTLLFSLLLVLPLHAQQSEFTLSSDYSMEIDGTSNVRDWSAEITSMEGVLLLREGTEENLSSWVPEDLISLELRIPVEDIETDSRKLTSNIHKYLKEDKQPVITFELQRIISVEPAGNGAAIQAEGVVTAAGKAHTTVMNVTAEQAGNGGVQFSGSQQVKMTDFDIEPPTAMLGAIRAVDEVTINYTVQFNQ